MRKPARLQGYLDLARDGKFVSRKTGIIRRSLGAGAEKENEFAS